MTTVRGLLAQSNSKLGGSVFHFDLPPVRTCPGRSRGPGGCEAVCYARHGRFVFPQVIERQDWCYAQSKLDSFADKMADELYRKGVLVMRWHVSGDVYSPVYARKIKAVAQARPNVRMYMYTRSWRVDAIAEVLWELAALPNFSLWLSADDVTKYPPYVPEGVRVAWMQTGDPPEEADLVFATRAARKEPARINLDLLCPTETDAGKRAGTTCSACQFCFTK